MRISFVRYRLFFFVFSCLVLLASIWSILFNGFAWGIDFTGGILLELGFEAPANMESIREILQDYLSINFSIQAIDESQKIFMLRMPPLVDSNAQSAFTADLLLHLKSMSTIGFEILQSETVGQSVGQEMRDKGFLAFLIALVGMMIYISFSFQYKFAIGAVIALLHDVIIILGIFSIFRLEISLTVIAAILTVIGYSINDTIVVYNRIREVLMKSIQGFLGDVINDALNKTLSRTFLTSLTTLCVVVSLLLFGGDSLRLFAFALLLGVTIGTYSSLVIASPLLLIFKLQKADVMPVKLEKKGEDLGP